MFSVKHSVLCSGPGQQDAVKTTNSTVDERKTNLRILVVKHIEGLEME